ncbi:TPA: hypothetical protein N0F65_005861 [Lagenidium giganteum]|uniref:Protein kinase domain-containing protein n=1 Tax=Lagenidium giganteum TaxID=4803 RepID=A0AAV2YS00_9STRA|nr:TPA: hypothetical protein N0F65_005861 [Lagenidium giganteum]
MPIPVLNELTTKAPLSSERLNPQVGAVIWRLNRTLMLNHLLFDAKVEMRRKLRQRDQEMTYIEPKINTKIRQGDYHGLVRRSQLNVQHLRLGARKNTSHRRCALPQLATPFEKRTLRRTRPKSYIEPKLNTKLRQLRSRGTDIMGCASSKQEQDITNAPPTVTGNVERKNPATRDDHKTGAAHGATNGPVNPNGFEENYTLGKTIGSGTFSVVREAIHKPTGQRYAIKCIKREGLVAEDIEALKTEVAILKEMNHPNIMILHDFFQEEKYYYLVTEFMAGGELFDRIVEKSYYSEREARDLVKLLLEAIKYCHDADIVHRDLKPENLLLTSKDDDASIKLADFGFAKKIEFDGEGLVTACGTPGYVAPEILEGHPYGKSVDIWSIGVITYILLCGYPPFHDDNHNALFKKIKKGKFQYDSPYWDHVSDEAKDLINKMLVVNPAERATAAQLLEHRWVTGAEVATVQLTSALEELKRFNARRKFRAAVSTVKATIALTKTFSNSSQRKTQSPKSPIQSVDSIQEEAEEGEQVSAANYRRFVLWPEGLRMRWNYWHEIELSEDCYKLKILGYYHRKIQKFLGRFPPSVSEESIQSYYRRRGIFLLSLFISAYLASTVLLFMSEKDANTRICVLYLLTVASGLVVMRFAKMHLIELPQVLALRERPEFAADFYPQATEKIPFARPVPAYQAVQPDQTPAVAVPTSASGIV